MWAALYSGLRIRMCCLVKIRTRKLGLILSRVSWLRLQQMGYQFNCVRPCFTLLDNISSIYIVYRILILPWPRRNSRIWMSWLLKRNIWTNLKPKNLPVLLRRKTIVTSSMKRTPKRNERLRPVQDHKKRRAKNSSSSFQSVFGKT